MLSYPLEEYPWSRISNYAKYKDAFILVFGLSVPIAVFLNSPQVTARGVLTKRQQSCPKLLQKQSTYSSKRLCLNAIKVLRTLTQQEANFPDINIVCEKLAFEGITRFEDRQQLPMGICVNLTAYAAKLCFQAAYNPMIMEPYRAFGVSTELKVQDTSAFTEGGEALSFWQMQVR